ncbi:E2 ubiquitin-protein ligase peroxin 4 [Saitoella coloradoensis]
MASRTPDTGLLTVKSILSSYLPASAEPTLPTNLPAILETLISQRPLAAEARDQEECAATLHKWTTRLSSLVQAKSAGVRWAGVCLIKATLEQSWDCVLSHGATWSRLLIAILGRPEPPVLLERTIVTLKALFRLTRGKPALIRDITTPALPGYFASLVALCSNDYLLQTALGALHETLIEHPTTFRPFAGKLTPVCLAILDGSRQASPKVEMMAAKCFASLYLCAPKNGSADEWRKGLLAVVGEAHVTLDALFRFVDEDRDGIINPGGMGMPELPTHYASAVVTGGRRFAMLIKLLEVFLSLGTKMEVRVPVGVLIDLFTRVTDIKFNALLKPATDKNEQGLFFSHLPSLHIATVKFAHTLIRVLSHNFLPHFDSFVTQASGLLQSTTNEELRQALYEALDACTTLFGAGISNAKVLNTPITAILSDLARLAPPSARTPVEDAIATASASGSNTKNPRKRKAPTSDAPAKLSGAMASSDALTNPAAFHRAPSTKMLEAALGLLRVCLGQCMPQAISPSLRSSIDRVLLELSTSTSVTTPSSVCVLLHDTLVASVLSPSSTQAAILPHVLRVLDSASASHSTNADLARAKLACVEQLDAVLHTRFPPLRKVDPNGKAKEGVLSLMRGQQHDEEAEESGEDDYEARVAPPAPVWSGSVSAVVTAPSVVTAAAPVVQQQQQQPSQQQAFGGAASWSTGFSASAPVASVPAPAAVAPVMPFGGFGTSSATSAPAITMPTTPAVEVPPVALSQPASAFGVAHSQQKEESMEVDQAVAEGNDDEMPTIDMGDDSDEDDE